MEDKVNVVWECLLWKTNGTVWCYTDRVGKWGPYSARLWTRFKWGEGLNTTGKRCFALHQCHNSSLPTTPTAFLPLKSSWGESLAQSNKFLHPKLLQLIYLLFPNFTLIFLIAALPDRPSVIHWYFSHYKLLLYFHRARMLTQTRPPKYTAGPLSSKQENSHKLGSQQGPSSYHLIIPLPPSWLQGVPNGRGRILLSGYMSVCHMFYA